MSTSLKRSTPCNCDGVRTLRTNKCSGNELQAERGDVMTTGRSGNGMGETQVEGNYNLKAEKGNGLDELSTQGGGLWWRARVSTGCSRGAKFETNQAATKQNGR